MAGGGRQMTGVLVGFVARNGNILSEPAQPCSRSRDGDTRVRHCLEADSTECQEARKQLMVTGLDESPRHASSPDTKDLTLGRAPCLH